MHAAIGDIVCATDEDSLIGCSSDSRDRLARWYPMNQCRNGIEADVVVLHSKGLSA